jgi:choline dehydrogenase-like flavoprotein
MLFLDGDRAGTVPRECSVAIVGAGLAGLELARELDARGVREVLVIEAGGSHDTRHVNLALDPDAAARLWLQPETDRAFRRPWQSDTPPHYTGAAGIRERVGGRSLYWYGVTLPIEPWALADWPAAVVVDLTDAWQDGSSLYDRLSARLLGEPGGWPDGGEEKVAGLLLRKTPEALRRDPADGQRWHAYSPLDAWRDPVTGAPLADRPSCRVVSGAEVLEVLHDAAGCHGVRIRLRASGATVTVRADDVVLAAGALESSRLAIQALVSRGALDRPRLEGLNDHLVQGFLARFTGSAATRLLERLPPGNRFAPSEIRSNVYVETVDLGGGAALLDVRASGEQLRSPSCFVECCPVDGTPWPYRAHAVASSADREVLAAQRNVLSALWQDLAPTGQPLRFDDFDAPARTNESVLPEHLGAVPPGRAVTWASYLGSEDHEGGTLPLGAVLTDRHEFADLPHLYAAGPATFSRAGAANPGLTALALAHRLAGVLACDRGK